MSGAAELTARFEWKLEDLWIGAFWKRSREQLDIWICLLPCVPLHIVWRSAAEREGGGE